MVQCSLMEKMETVKGILKQTKVIVQDDPSIQFLSEKGYGDKKDGKLELLPWETIHLASEGWLEVYSESLKRKIEMKELIEIFSKKEKRIWSKYLVYRDLRSRGYIVKLGSGWGADFRVYERGLYGKEAARILVCSVQEGEETPIKNFVNILNSAVSLKKQLIIAVIERRGEVVYYSLAQFSL